MLLFKIYVHSTKYIVIMSVYNVNATSYRFLRYFNKPCSLVCRNIYIFGTTNWTTQEDYIIKLMLCPNEIKTIQVAVMVYFQHTAMIILITW